MRQPHVAVDALERDGSWIPVFGLLVDYAEDSPLAGMSRKIGVEVRLQFETEEEALIAGNEVLSSLRDAWTRQDSS